MLMMNGSLSVTHTGKYDSGTYMCVGINQVGSVNGSIKVGTILDQPFIYMSSS